MTDIVLIILLAIATEAVSEIITSASITEPLRDWWKRWTYKSDEPPVESYFQQFKIFIDKLVSCGYCTSVWVAAFFAIWAPLFIDYIVSNWLVCAFAIHRIANLVHVIYELIRKGRVKTHDLLLKVSIEDDENGIIGEGKGESGI